MATYGQEVETEGQVDVEAPVEDTPDGRTSQSYSSVTGTGSVTGTIAAVEGTPSPNLPIHHSPISPDIEMLDQNQHVSNYDGSQHSPSIAEVIQAAEHDILQAAEDEIMQNTENEVMQVTKNDAPDIYHDFACISPADTAGRSYPSPEKNLTPGVFYDESSPFTPSRIPIAYASPGVLYTERPIWPLKSSQEAHLMRFFLDRVAPAIDLCDRDRHFTLVVPQRASQCPTLLNAIFAASARHLASISDFDPLISNRYNQECLKHLIPKLGDTEAIMDENLLAATVILRHLEELELSMTGADAENHLLGTHLLMSAQEHHRALAGGLRKAVYWFGLRQEIYVSFLKQRPVHDSFKRCSIDIPLDPVDDFDWSNSIIARTAEVIQFCFDEAEHSTTNYDMIVSHFDAWYMGKPDSYMPIYSAEPNANRVFPELWYLNDAVITGLQHYHLGRAMLAVYNPRIPRLGMAHRNAMKEVGETLKHHIKIICGIAVSNKSISASHVHATMLIAMGGDRFTDRREQEALLDLLVKTQVEHAWPTSSVYVRISSVVAIFCELIKIRQEHLKEVWGW